jgi:hypothetical protein
LTFYSLRNKTITAPGGYYWKLGEIQHNLTMTAEESRRKANINRNLDSLGDTTFAEIAALIGLFEGLIALTSRDCLSGSSELMMVNRIRRSFFNQWDHPNAAREASYRE